MAKLKNAIMNLRLFNSPNRWKDSLAMGFAILAGIETILAVSSVSLNCIWGKYNWLVKLLLVLVLFFILVIVTFIIKHYLVRKGISMKIRGIDVHIRQGDLFKARGWKVIAFNEYFDTTVDDIIIAHNTINGIFIDNYVEDLKELKEAIKNEVDDYTKYKKHIVGGKNKYPLGRIITYKDYMLLSFTHFVNNQARLNQKDYEDCLRVMWTEICRTYANKPIFIPLLGSGITRFDGTPNKSKTNLLKCMLCTLRTCEANINQPITILLTEEAMSDINIYEFKRVK